MATHYVEFDTNSQALFQDLRTQILTSTDWARLTPDTVLLNTSTATAALGTSLPFAATAGSGLAIGSVISIGDGAVREYRTITAITATAITVAAMTYAHPQASPIRWGNEVYKATTTRGADMIIDLNDAHLAVTDANLKMAVYRSHDGLVGTDKSLRYLYWRSTAGAANHPLHVILSLGKEHFFLSVEGPRGGETGAANATYGSYRNYVFLNDVTPYDPGDIPVVFAGGSYPNSASAAFTIFSHIGHTSRNLAGITPWAQARLETLEFPKAGYQDTFNVQRLRALDSKYIFSPYVVFLDDTGMRGRLNSFFFAGYNQPDLGSTDVAPPQVGAKQEYQGNWYKLLAVNKSDSNISCWNQFGAANQANSTTFQRSPVVAVPCLP